MEGLFYNKYKKEKLIGRGAFSEVWMVTDTLTGVTQALKIYSPSAKMDDDGVQMMIHEFALMANVNHQNLLHPLMFDIFDNHPFLVLPFCKNGNINKKVGKFTEKEAWELLHDAASGLAYLHAMEPPVIHQDIKPDNILIGDDGTYMLTDFGVSTKAKSTLSRITDADKSLLSAGTLSYMAPEKFSSNNLPIMANDIFSLGSTVYEMLTGYLPFGNEGGLLQKMGADVPELQGDFSAELKETVKECLCKEPWNRPTAKKLAQRAANMLYNTDTVKFEEKPAVSTTHPTPTLPEEPVTQSPKYGLMIAVIVVLLVAGAAAAWWLLSKDNPTEEAPLVEASVSTPYPDVESATQSDAPSVAVEEPSAETTVPEETQIAQEMRHEEAAKPVEAAKIVEKTNKTAEAKTNETQPAEPGNAKGGNLPYGSWNGKVVGGQPDGVGTLTFRAAHTFRCNNGKLITPQAGDKFTNAEFIDGGTLYQATWKKANGEEVAIIP